MSTVYRLIDAQERIFDKACKKLKGAKKAFGPDRAAASELMSDARDALSRARAEGERTSMPKLEAKVDAFKDAVDGLL